MILLLFLILFEQNNTCLASKCCQTSLHLQEQRSADMLSVEATSEMLIYLFEMSKNKMLTNWQMQPMSATNDRHSPTNVTILRV